MFIDSGTYVYTTDLETRNLLRSGLAHNCLTVDGRSLSEPDGPFSWKSAVNARLLAAEAANGEFKISAATDGFVRLGVEHCRTAILTPGEGLVLTDTIATDERHEITLSFVLAPDIEARLSGDKICLSSRAEPNSLMVCGETRAKENGNVISSSWEIDDAAISPIYGKLVPTKIIRSRVVAAGEVEIVTTFRW
ncbi:MAG: heparinase II/III-family protein [Acidobacteria bacterium]|nr:heparinase II/III-family protein [Acidobacteriota bacterium]